MSIKEPLVVNSDMNDYSQASSDTIASGLPILNNSSESQYLLDNSQIIIKDGTSWKGCIFLVVNAALGAGLLNFPEAFHLSGGFAVAIPIQIILCLFVIASMYMLIVFSNYYKCESYELLIEKMIGRIWAGICSFCIIAYSFGSCIAYIIIVGDQWEKFLQAVYPSYNSTWYLNRKMCMGVTSTIFILPLCYARRIDFLKYASSVGVIAVLYCVFVVIIRYFIGSSNIDYAPLRTRPEHWTDVFLIVPAICFAYQCHLSLVPIYSCCNEKSPSQFSGTIFISIGLCFFLYTATAIFGYLTFGSCVLPDILSSYYPSADVLIAVICIALKMYTVYPLILFVGRGAIETMWIKCMRISEADEKRTELRRRIIITTLWFVASLILSLFVPDIDKVIAMLGSFAALFIFVFPGLCLFLLILNSSDEMDLFNDLSYQQYIIAIVISIIFISLGVFIFGIIVTTIIYNNIENIHEIKPIQCM